jgi:hypothetical protein
MFCPLTFPRPAIPTSTPPRAQHDITRRNGGRQSGYKFGSIGRRWCSGRTCRGAEAAQATVRGKENGGRGEQVARSQCQHRRLECYTRCERSHRSFAYDLRLIRIWSRPTASYCPRAEHHPRRHPSRYRHQRSHRPPPPELQLRDPQMHSPHTHFGRDFYCPAIPRRPAAVRDDNIGYFDTLLSWHNDIDHGRCNVWSVLHRRLYS